MENAEIARIFEEIADILELRGDNPFRIRSYRRAAQVVGSFPQRLEEMCRRGEDLSSISGVGKALAGKIKEIVETGDCDKHRELMATEEASLLELLKIPGVGPRHVKMFYDVLGIKTVDDLEKAAKSGKLASLPGMGEKSQENILRGIEDYRSMSGRFPLGLAVQYAEAAVNRLAELEHTVKIEIAGSLRRRRDTVGDIDVLVCSDAPEEAAEAFVSLPEVDRVILKGHTKVSVRLRNGLQMDLRIVPRESFGAALHYFTGSKNHNVAVREIARKLGLKINEYGVFRGEDRVGGAEEDDIFNAVGLCWIPPELREGGEEIDAARDGTLPHLVELFDIRGDLHVHTTYSDGRLDVEEMAIAAQKMGYEYIAVTDHSRAVGVAGGVGPEELLRLLDDVEEVNRSLDGITVLGGVEVDILKDGFLDLPDEVLERCDVVVASVHMAGAGDNTGRILDAMQHPCVNIIGHPTGRLIGQRQPYEVDMDKILARAADLNVAMEINAHPSRLDLKDTHCRRAKEMGVNLVISTDAHSAEGLCLMRFGVWTARRGWIEREDVINTRSLGELLMFLRARRGEM